MTVQARREQEGGREREDDSEIGIGVDSSERSEEERGAAEEEEEEEERRTLGAIFHSWKQNGRERTLAEATREGRSEREKAFKCNVFYSYRHDSLRL